MGWEWAMTQERWKLKHFIVLLFALSAIACRTANAPGPLRCLMLSILLRAAPVAVNYVVSDEPIVFDTGDSRDDLIYLASLFRMAALALNMWLNSVPEHEDVKVRELLKVARLIESMRKAASDWVRYSMAISRHATPGFDTS